MDIRNIIKSRYLRDKIMYSLSFLPDAMYVRLFYFAVNGKHLNLKNPKGFNEKLQWLKLNNRNPAYTELSDKLRVRDVIARELGEDKLFPLLGYWESFDQIDFSKLPNEFVLKCNHDSGSVKIIENKDQLTEADYQQLRKKYNRHMAHDFFYAGREYPYKGIKRYIMAEKLMRDSNGDPGGIKDYKFFCFNGEPKLLLIVSGRQTTKHEDYFDMDFNWLTLYNGSDMSPVCPEKPKCFEEMKKAAYQLSKGMPQVRLDFYELDGKFYFGEYTFFSGGGNELFYPLEWERKLDDWIVLP